MKKTAIILFTALTLFACEQYPNPGSEVLEAFNFNVLGKNQMQPAGEYLEQEVGVYIDLNSVIPRSDNHYKLEIEVTQGGGRVDKNIVIADSYGKMTTRWQLGSESNDQVLTCRILDSETEVYPEFSITATALLPNSLNILKSGILVGIDDMVSDTLNQRSMMFNQGQIWVTNDEFYTWRAKGFPFNTYVRMIDMNSEGTVFAAGWNGELYKSEDWGESWTYVCNPVPGNVYYYNFNITSDDYLWASKSSYGVYCSKDNGITWTKDTTELMGETTLGPIYKYGNSYLTIGSNPMSIMQSCDDGISWNAINTPEYSLSMYVPNDSTIIAQNQGGFELHKSTDDGESFRQVFAPYTSMGGGNLWHVYSKYGNNYYVLAPSGGVWKTRDFEEFEKLIGIETYQQKLFIDHKGNIYVAGYRFSNADDDPTLVLPAME